MLLDTYLMHVYEKIVVGTYDVPGKHLALEVLVHQSVLVGYYVLFDAQLHVPKDDGICICVTEQMHVKLC